jgi:hypothetical protein
MLPMISRAESAGTIKIEGNVWAIGSAGADGCNPWSGRALKIAAHAFDRAGDITGSGNVEGSCIRYQTSGAGALTKRRHAAIASRVKYSLLCPVGRRSECWPAYLTTHCFARPAFTAGRILKGTKPAELPVQLPTKFRLIINFKTAKALDLEVPSSLSRFAATHESETDPNRNRRKILVCGEPLRGSRVHRRHPNESAERQNAAAASPLLRAKRKYANCAIRGGLPCRAFCRRHIGLRNAICGHLFVLVAM